MNENDNVLKNDKKIAETATKLAHPFARLGNAEIPTKAAKGEKVIKKSSARSILSF